MNELDISFEESPWELYLNALPPERPVSAARLLTLLEDADEEVFQEALEDLEDQERALDLTDLPRPGSGGEAALRLRQEQQLVKSGFKPGDLEQGDPLRLYLEEVAALPEDGNEQLLAQAWAAGEEAAAERLTNLGLRRVLQLAQEHVGRGVLLLDLIQEGSMGLWQAIQNFSGGSYAARRDHWVRFYMARAVTVQARASGIGQKMRTALEDYRAVDQRLLAELGRNPTLEEMAEGLHRTLEETAAVKKNLDDAYMLAQVRKNPETEEQQQEEEQAVEDTAQFQMRQRIQDLLSGLEERDRRLLELRFGLEGGKPLSPEEAGRRLGLTPQEVMERETAALAGLRGTI